MMGDQIPAIGIDIDGTIDELPVFFSTLSNIWPGKVYIISYRIDYDGAREDLRRFKISPKAEIILAESYKDKSRIIREKNIKVFFDDMDEVITHIDPDVLVLKVRNGGNFENGKWLYDMTTGKCIG